MSKNHFKVYSNSPIGVGSNKSLFLVAKMIEHTGGIFPFSAIVWEKSVKMASYNVVSIINRTDAINAGVKSLGPGTPNSLWYYKKDSNGIINLYVLLDIYTSMYFVYANLEGTVNGLELNNLNSVDVSGLTKINFL